MKTCPGLRWRVYATNRQVVLYHCELRINAVVVNTIPLISLSIILTRSSWILWKKEKCCQKKRQSKVKHIRRFKQWTRMTKCRTKTSINHTHLTTSIVLIFHNWRCILLYPPIIQPYRSYCNSNLINNPKDQLYEIY